MKTALLMLGACCAMTLSLAAQAECIYPRFTSEIPDGKTASQEQIVTAMGAVKKYNEEINGYLGCLEMEAESQIAALAEPTPEQIKQIKGMQTAKHNAAVDELESHATRFNEALRAFKAKNPR